MMSFIPGCVTCASDGGCDDSDTCTTDTCSEGMCTRDRAEECCDPSPEICGDGVDNDCDGRTDCEDGNCEAAPSCAPKPEICGNCLDDDGNGLTDFEDAACCSARQAYPMKLRRGRMLSEGPTSRVRLRSALSQKAPMHVDPRKQDVFVQLRPEGGTDLLCARIPAKKFMGMRRKFKFWDKKRMIASARGLTDMAVIVKKNGSVRFRAKGRKTQMTGAKAGMLQVTVGFLDPGGDAGNRCSTTHQTFRAGASGKLRAP
jgi:hypothetical protein